MWTVIVRWIDLWVIWINSHKGFKTPEDSEENGKKKSNPKPKQLPPRCFINESQPHQLRNSKKKKKPIPPHLEGSFCLFDFNFSFNIQVTQLVSPVKPATSKSLILKKKIHYHSSDTNGDIQVYPPVKPLFFVHVKISLKDWMGWNKLR